MDYYKLFNLEKEPFSNTPDPDFFYRSNMHAKCLMDLEIVLRLRRGLCLVEGEVGTGKTTLCRQLIRVLSGDEKIEVHLVFDPAFESTLSFAKAINGMLHGPDKAGVCNTTGQHKEMIKNYLFKAGVDEDRIVVLIIDEGQKLSGECVEFLRELLNYETNEHKLLQIVIFAQNEIQDLLDAHPNFNDRVALYHCLASLGKYDTQKLIFFRLQRAERDPQGALQPVFTSRALSRIYRLTGGHPRKIIHLAHNILLLLLIMNKTKVTPAVVNQAAKRVSSLRSKKRFFEKPAHVAACISAALLLALVAAGFVHFSLAPGVLTGEKTVVFDNGAANGAAEVAYLHTGENDAPAAPENKTAKAPVSQSGEPRPDKIAKPPAIKPPAYLGEILIRPDEKLWNMLVMIYGESGGRMVEAVQGANPDMVNPDFIRPGQAVVFPVLQTRSLRPEEHYWVAFEKTAQLEAACRFLRETTETGLRLVSVWSPGDDLLHAVVKKESFENKNEATGRIDKLPPGIRDKARVLDASHDGLRLVNAIE